MRTKTKNKLKENNNRILIVGFYIFIDTLIISLYFTYLYMHRFSATIFPTNPITYLFNNLYSSDHFQVHFQLAMLMGLFLVVLNYTKKLYSTPRGVRFSEELGALIGNIFIVFIFGIALSFLFQWHEISRQVIILFAAGLIPLLGLWRFIKRKVLDQLVRKGYNRKASLIVGAGKYGVYLQSIINEQREMGLDVVGFIDDNHKNNAGQSNGLKILGPLSCFTEVVIKNNIQDVFITIPSERKTIKQLVEEANQLGANIHIIPESYDLLSRQLKFESIGSLTIVTLAKPALKYGQRFLKRSVDIIVASLVLLLCLPLLLIIIMAIKLDSPGPVIYRQKRLAGHDEHFMLYKFRSMDVNSDQRKHVQLAKDWVTSSGGFDEESGVYKLVNDDRITRVGKIIRKLNLDELPQFFNVIRGDMSIVGPRPPLPYEYEEYKVYHKNRLYALPGITGLWQVSGLHKLSFEEMVMLDIRYVNEWSLWLDLEIMLRTLPILLFGRGR